MPAKHWKATSVAIAYFCLVSLATADQPAPTVHLIGDSTMAPREHSTGNPEYGWGEALPAFFVDEVVVKNHAVGGRSTRSFIAEGRWERAKKEIQSGDWVIIQFGHNDQKKDKPDKFADAQTDYKNFLEVYVRETRDLGAEPIIATSIYRRAFTKYGKLKSTLGDYPTAAEEIAKTLNVPVIDMNSATGELIKTYGQEGSKVLFLHFKSGEHDYYPNGKRDNSHLSKTGAEAVAKTFVDELKRQNIALTAWLSK